MLQTRFDYFVISKFRNVLFGIAIWSIMIFHFAEDKIRYCDSDSWIIKILNQGVIGVEIFLFLSGIGLYFSMKKNSSLVSFFKKRFVRILVPVLLTLPMFWFLYELVFQNKPDRFWPNVTLFSFFADGNGQFWFIAAILFLYLLFPLLFWFFELPNKLSEKWREPVKLLQVILLIGGVILAVSAAENFLPEFYKNTNIALKRIPVFLLGTYFGHLVYEKKRVSWLFTVLMLLVLVLKIYFTVTQPFARYRYLDAVTAAALCYFLSLLLQLIHQNWLNRFFCFFGGMTLELYIIHVSIRAMCVMKKYFVTYIPWHYLVILGFSVLYAWVIKTAGDKISDFLLKPRRLK